MLHFNYQLVVDELSRRGINCSLIGQSEYVKATYDNHTEYFMECGHTQLPVVYHYMLNDKYMVKQLVQNAGLVVAPSNLFLIDQKKEAIAYAKELGFPVVLKGTIFSHGSYVFPAIQTSEEMEYIWDVCVLGGDPYVGVLPTNLLVEKHIYGNDYRFLVFNDSDTVIVKRMPPTIMGDGRSTIRELIDKENYSRMNPRITCSGEIYLSDKDGLRCLQHQHKTLDDILQNGVTIPLRYNSNVTCGGTCEIIDNSLIHNSYLELTKKIFLLFPNLKYLAIDLLVVNPEQAATPDNYVVSEFCTYPGFSLFLMPTYGAGVDVVKIIVDKIFPETIGHIYSPQRDIKSTLDPEKTPHYNETPMLLGSGI